MPTRRKRKSHYRSKAYEAYRERVRYKHFGDNWHQLGAALADSLHYMVNRTGFLRRFLETPEQREARLKQEAEQLRLMQERQAERQRKLEAYRAELLPYSRHYDYNSKCRGFISQGSSVPYAKYTPNFTPPTAPFPEDKRDYRN